METDVGTLEILVGAVGWRRPDWRGVFYPQDLPGEWRLSYYANEFSCVLVPPDYWLEGALPDVARWREEVPEGFEFHVLIDDRLLHVRYWPAIMGAMAGLGTTLGGAVLACSGAAGRRAWEEIRAACPQLGLACLDHAMAGNPGPCRAHRRRPGLRGAGAVGLLALAEPVHPRALRGMLEDFAAQGRGPRRALFLDAPYPVLEQTLTLLRLLGW
jgi:hypothetical protein